MPRRKLQAEEPKYLAQRGCAVLTLVNSQYVWSCVQTGAAIIKQKRLDITRPNYDEEAHKRHAALVKALDKHNANHK